MTTKAFNPRTHKGKKGEGLERWPKGSRALPGWLTLVLGDPISHSGLHRHLHFQVPESHRETYTKTQTNLQRWKKIWAKLSKRETHTNLYEHKLQLQNVKAKSDKCLEFSNRQIQSPSHGTQAGHVHSNNWEQLTKNRQELKSLWWANDQMSTKWLWRDKDNSFQAETHHATSMCPQTSTIMMQNEFDFSGFNNNTKTS